jgi:hypothetical protein
LNPTAWDEAQKRPIDTPSRGSLKYKYKNGNGTLD